VAVFYGFIANGGGLFVQRPEFFASGWYAIATGLISLFFVERAPFLWVMILDGGMCLVFGAVSMAWGGGRRSTPGTSDSPGPAEGSR
jgi:hypothetical protein